mmetsp:Transcript_26785/g.79936  ORF Transcript_26785/g.79936 Transcript_26785/m.79936 type:complete len:236 (+) Transcript_26785:274-981(+)
MYWRAVGFGTLTRTSRRYSPVSAKTWKRPYLSWPSGAALSHTKSSVPTTAIPLKAKWFRWPGSHLNFCSSVRGSKATTRAWLSTKPQPLLVIRPEVLAKSVPSGAQITSQTRKPSATSATLSKELSVRMYRERMSSHQPHRPCCVAASPSTCWYGIVCSTWKLRLSTRRFPSGKSLSGSSAHMQNRSPSSATIALTDQSPPSRGGGCVGAGRNQGRCATVASHPQRHVLHTLAAA